MRTTCPRQIYECIINNWHAIRHEWVLGLKLCEGALLNKTNNQLESFNQKLKQVVRLYSSLDIIFERFIALINTLRNERDHRGSKDIQKKPLRMNEIDDTTPEFKYYEFLTGYANKFVTYQLAKIRFNKHFFRNACTKSGSLRFSVFRLLTDFVCLYNYEF